MEYRRRRSWGGRGGEGVHFVHLIILTWGYQFNAWKRFGTLMILARTADAHTAFYYTNPKKIGYGTRNARYTNGTLESPSQT